MTARWLRRRWPPPALWRGPSPRPPPLLSRVEPRSLSCLCTDWQPAARAASCLTAAALLSCYSHSVSVCLTILLFNSFKLLFVVNYFNAGFESESTKIWHCGICTNTCESVSRKRRCGRGASGPVSLSPSHPRVYNLEKKIGMRSNFHPTQLLLTFWCISS